MGQLRMRIPALNDLPQPRLNEGYRFHDASAEDAADYALVIRESFGGAEHDFTREVVSHSGYWPGATTLIYHGTGPVATATAICGTNDDPNEGYLHMVGALPSHKGNGLGYQACLHCLWKMRERGMGSCVLDTDDFRVPAIVTYLRLGFRPVLLDQEHEARWRTLAERLSSNSHPSLIDWLGKMC